MLNRHVLRIKAMQAIYAYRQSRNANYYLALDQISTHYADELMVVGKAEQNRLQAEEAEARTFFEQNYDNISYNGIPEKNKQPSPKEVGRLAVITYNNRVAKDLQLFKTRMVKDTEQLFERYIRLLKLILMLADFVGQEHQERAERLRKEVKVTDDFLRFMRNPLLDTLRQLKEFEVEWAKNKFTWNPDDIRTWYKVLIKEDDFLNLLKNPETPPYEIIRYIINQFIFKYEPLETYLEEQDLNWTENRYILRNMVLKTFKEKADNPESEMRLFTLSRNWEDDGQFFVQLFDAAIANEKQFNDWIAEKSKKWAYDRIAEIDKILMHLALGEILTFPSIPVKVTINEYVDISKEYSTPKSWQFINGILDVVVNNLEKQGKIRKSGRGLIDNRS